MAASVQHGILQITDGRYAQTTAMSQVALYIM